VYIAIFPSQIAEMSTLVSTQQQAMPTTPETDVELGHVSTSRLSVAMPDEVVDGSSYGKRLAHQFLNLGQLPDYEDKILTFRKLRRYNIARIQHDLLKLYYDLKTTNEGEDENRIKLTSLLRDHGTHLPLD
jgi:hypothetical protein